MQSHASPPGRPIPLSALVKVRMLMHDNVALLAERSSDMVRRGWNADNRIEARLQRHEIIQVVRLRRPGPVVDAHTPLLVELVQVHVRRLVLQADEVADVRQR